MSVSDFERRHTIRERWVYALLFVDRRCYIGQSINTDKRIGWHRARCGRWDEDFDSSVLCSFIGTDNEGRWLEYAWRWAAQLTGWSVYAAPDVLLDNAGRWTWPEIKEFGSKLKWDAEKGPIGSTYQVDMTELREKIAAKKAKREA